MASDYEIETPEFLEHGLRVYQRTMLSMSEDEHIYRCCRLAGYQRGDKVCDMGSGVGYVAHRMCVAEKLEMVGVTNSPFQYSYAAEHYPGPTWLLADMEETELPEDYFDAVQWMESIGHVDHGKAFKEAYRVLKMQGKIIVKDFAAIKDASLVSESWSYRFISAGEMVKVAELAGFRLVRAFMLDGDSSRYEKYYQDSNLMQRLHPQGVKAGVNVPFWYEFVKVLGGTPWRYQIGRGHCRG